MAGTFNQPNNFIIVEDQNIGNDWKTVSLASYVSDPGIGVEWSHLFLDVKGLTFNSTDLDGLHGFFAVLDLQLNGTFASYCISGATSADVQTQGPIKIPYPSRASAFDKLNYRCRIVGTPQNIATAAPVVVAPTKFSAVLEITFAN